MRFVLAPLRAALFVLHVLAGLAIVLVVFPFLGLPGRNRVNRAWSLPPDRRRSRAFFSSPLLA